jgi:hypothetical protein
MENRKYRIYIGEFSKEKGYNMYYTRNTTLEIAIEEAQESCIKHQENCYIVESGTDEVLYTAQLTTQRIVQKVIRDVSMSNIDADIAVKTLEDCNYKYTKDEKKHLKAQVKYLQNLVDRLNQLIINKD